MTSLKRQRTKTVTFLDRVEVLTQTPGGHWTFERRPINRIPFTSIYNTMYKILKKSTDDLTVDRVYDILELFTPKGMTQEQLLSVLVNECQRRQQILIRRGWVQLGENKCTIRQYVQIMIYALNETGEDLEILKELYSFSDDEDEAAVTQCQKNKRRGDAR